MQLDSNLPRDEAVHFDGLVSGAYWEEGIKESIYSFSVFLFPTLFRITELKNS